MAEAEPKAAQPKVKVLRRISISPKYIKADVELQHAAAQYFTATAEFSDKLKQVEEYGKQKWTKSYSIRASESVRMRNGRSYGCPRPRSRLGGGQVLAITTTPMLSTLPRPPVTQRQKPLLIS